MRKWRYDVVELDFREGNADERLDDRRKLVTTLDEFGAEGWELVNAQIVGEMAYLFLKKSDKEEEVSCFDDLRRLSGI